MAVRNFWVTANIDGRQHQLTGGPRAKDGGIDITIHIRHAGEAHRALRIEGWADADGKLRLTARPTAMFADMDNPCKTIEIGTTR